MRLLSIKRGATGSCAVEVDNGSLIDLGPDGCGITSSIQSIIEGGSAMRDRVEAAIATAPAHARLKTADISLLPVLPNPGKFICLGLNFSDHAAEGGFEVPDYPALFLRASSSLIADGDPILRPVVSETLDYEAELAVVIGSPARHVSEDQALSHVFGYTIFNDATVREHQRKTHQWTAGKNFDNTGAFGPVIVTADELPDGATGLRIQSRLNGKVMQDSNLANLIFSVARTISILSEIMTLQPGDVVAMGTPEGVGHARRPQVWMKAGDVCEIEIERIGVLSNPIKAEGPQTSSASAAE